MENKETNNPLKKITAQEKILLALLPFWTPLIPPMGIACLKSYLSRHGYKVKIADANTEEDLREMCDEYFETLKGYIPGENQGNFFNIGVDVWQNHMMAHLNYIDETEYIGLVKILVHKTFYVDIGDYRVSRLNKIINEFYRRLEKYFIHLLNREKPSVLGLSVYSGTLAASLFAFKLTKEKYPHIKTVMGGGIFSEPLAPGSPNLEFFLEKTRQYIDKIIIGEGEILFLKLMRGGLDNSQRVYSLKDINGEILDLSSAAIPDLSDFDLRHYLYLPAYTSRSCPFQCGFCSEALQWGPYRKKSASQVVEELIKLNNRQNFQLFLMGDSLLNPIIAGLTREFAKTGTSIYWDGYLRADKRACDTGNTLSWRRAGFYRARLGLESGSRRILESMGKKISVKQIKSAVSSLAYAGIKTTTYWVIGYPGETEEDFRQTLDLIEELKDDIYEADCNPFAYFLTGQVNSQRWAEKYRPVPLYPGNAKDMLVVQTWIMDCQPTREETFRRVNRFSRHCKNIGVPNPYTLNDIYKADERWQRLHENSVPPLLAFQARDDNGLTCIDENKKVKKLVHGLNTQHDDGDWGFD